MALTDLGSLLSMVAFTVVVLTVQELRAGRRRSALNEALHELRRPLQAIALAGSAADDERSGVISGSIGLLASALEQLDGVVNGRPQSPTRDRIAVDPLLRSAVRRWQSRAALAGVSVTMGAEAGGIVLAADGPALSQALDNLIVNAIEHGGPSIVVEGRREYERLLLTVTDDGRELAAASRSGSGAKAMSRLTGRRRRGHGLAVVRRVAAAHGGGFVMHRYASASVATLNLPLVGERGAVA
jgi:signal transduction histidine kinase